MRTGGEKEYKASSGSEKESKEEREKKKRERERESGLSHGVGVVYYERVN